MQLQEKSNDWLKYCSISVPRNYVYRDSRQTKSQSILSFRYLGSLSVCAETRSGALTP